MADGSPPVDPPIVDVECEQALLGALLLNNEVASRCGFVREEHFGEPLHGRIWATATRLIGEGVDVGPVLLKPYFADDPAMAHLGGPVYLARLAGGAVSIFNAADFARAIVDVWRRRQVIEACQAGAAMTLDRSLRTNDAIAAVEGALLSIGDGGEERDRPRSLARVLIDDVIPLLDGTEPAPAPCSGLTALDEIVGGWMPGELVILAGRPGMGKSAFALWLARAAAIDGWGVHFASLEMSPGQCGVRLASAEVWAQRRQWVQYSRILRRKLTDEESRLVVDQTRTLDNLPLRFGSQRASTVGAIAADMRRSKAVFGDERPMGLLIVDHLGWVKPPRQRQNKVHEVGDAVRGLKELAVQQGCAVVLCSQLNRQVEARDDKRPSLADLRDSGDVEQDADIVLFPFRPEHYLLKNPPAEGASDEKVQKHVEALENARNRMCIHVAKNRRGAEGHAWVWCDVSVNAFAGEGR